MNHRAPCVRLPRRSPVPRSPPLSAAGCAEDFEPYNRLTGAARARDPERAGRAGAGRDQRPSTRWSTPPPGDRVDRLRLELVPVAGAGQRRLPVPDHRGGAGALAGGRGLRLPPVRPGHGEPPRARRTRSIPALLAAAVRRRRRACRRLLDCEGGFPVQIKLDGDQPAGDEVDGGARPAPALRPDARTRTPTRASTGCSPRSATERATASATTPDA